MYTRGDIYCVHGDVWRYTDRIPWSDGEFYLYADKGMEYSVNAKGPEEIVISEPC